MILKQQTQKIINGSIFILIFWISIFIFLYFFANRNGWEGDDIAQLEGIINFQYKGKIGVYNYYWQSLSYQLGIFIFSLCKSHNILFLIPQIFGATSLVILTLSVYIYSSAKLNFLLCFSFLIIFPELWFSSLYYNSTVFGMLPMSLSLLFLFWKNFPSNPIILTYKIRCYLTYIFLILACCFRIDFLFILPLTIYLLFINQDFEKNIFIQAILLLFLGFLISISLDLINFSEILKSIKGHSDNYINQKWSEKILFSLSNFYTLTNLIIWILIIIFLIYFIITRIKQKKIYALLGIIPALFSIAPVYILTTPKYLIPAIMFFLFFLAQIVTELKKILSKLKFSTFAYSFIFIAFLLQLISLQVTYSFPYIEITSKPYYTYSHDGVRLSGAYIQGYSKVKNQTPSDMELAQKIATMIQKSDKNYIIVSSETGKVLADSWNWFWLSYYFQVKGYQVISYKNYEEIILKKNNTITLKRLNKEKYDFYVQNKDNNILIIPIMKYDDEGYKKITDLSLQLNDLF